jgi:hypothetical protein
MSLHQIHKQINDLFYYSFDRLTPEDRAMLQNILQDLRDKMKGDF